MADEAQVCASAGRLPVKARLGIGDRGMGRVRPLLAAEVDFGIAISGFFGGHRGGLRAGFGIGIGIGIGVGAASAAGGGDGGSSGLSPPEGAASGLG